MEKSVTNYTNISEEFYSFFAEIGKTVSESVLSPAASFYSYIKDRSALYLFMQPVDTNEINKCSEKSKNKCTVS